MFTLLNVSSLKAQTARRMNTGDGDDVGSVQYSFRTRSGGWTHMLVITCVFVYTGKCVC